MAHKINVKHMYRLDSPERRKMLPPEETLFNAGLTKNDIFIDIGCGIGYFSIPASKIVGPKGKVFALDTSKEMLEELNRRINEDKITNIENIHSTPYNFHLDQDTGTFALISNVLHEVDDKLIFLSETNRVLKTNGKLCIIEWQKKETEKGPPLKYRLSELEVKKLLDQTNFKLLDSYSIADDFTAYISKNIKPNIS
ncbi:MAG: class I SAM-dependent methyltransferase [Methanofastidiosum sp.]|jgi:ubiquinone/menaquinone biosynthesis C-methylase UbiE|nr:class I SAM-dependent methyltransferase [Methanofastidiosum sp.]